MVGSRRDFKPHACTAPTKGESMLPPADVQMLRTIKKTAVLLLLLARVDRPLGESGIAAILDISRATVRGQLKSLSALGLVVRGSLHNGFLLSDLGRELFGLERVKFCPIPTTAVDLNLLNSLKSESEVNKLRKDNNCPIEPEPPTPHEEPIAPEIVAALRSSGIMMNKRTRALARMEHISPEYIRAHHKNLYLQKGLVSTGLLVSILESAQPMPDCGERDLHRYIEGKYAEFVVH
jgi:DNA-binding CsgD family transcriptional regulator